MSNSDNDEQVIEAAGAVPPIRMLREALAALEHEQWCEWSETLAESEQLSPERAERWSERWVSYDSLTEPDKDLDRAYADRVIALLAAFGLLTDDHEGAER